MSSLADFFTQSLAGHIGKDVVKRLQEQTAKEKATSGDHAAEVIDVVLSGGSIAPADISVLGVVKLLLSPCQEGTELPLAKWVLGEMKKPATKDELFQLLIPSVWTTESFKNNKVPSGITTTAVERLRFRIFKADHFGGMRVLTSQCSLEQRARSVADCVLRIMVRESLDPGTSALASAVKREFTGHKDADPPLSEEELGLALDFIRSLACLCRVVEEPEDVPRLYKRHYSTARRIAQDTRQEFVSRMGKVSMDSDRAVAVHDKAERIDCWSEHLWLALMEARQGACIPIAPRQGGGGGGDGAGDISVGDVAHNNLTDIFRLEDAGCETCCSATSLSAYFADLMTLLSSTSCKPMYARSLLDVLVERRPDLKKLELTCANSQILIPYIALVNETLESFIRHSYKGAPALTGSPKRVFNTQAGLYASQDYSCRDPGGVTDVDDEPVYMPGTTDAEIYSKIIARQMFPFTDFPYNQARDASTQILRGFQVAMEDLVKAFGCSEIILQSIPRPKQSGDLGEKLARGAAEVLARQQAAEALGMQQAEFVAITGGTFFPEWFADLVRGIAGTTRSPIKIDTACPWDVAALWGYESTETMTERVGGLGLSFIKRQLMRRSGLEFQEVLDIISTRFFNQNLVITNKSGSGQFDSSIENLRLLGGSSTPPFTALSQDDCFRLQSFIRLRSRLKWSTRDLDVAIHCLRAREIESTSGLCAGSIGPTDCRTLSVSAGTIRGLAAIVRLRQLSGIDIESLLPLWGPMDAYDEKTLLYRTFFTPALEQISPVFQRPTGGRLFMAGSSKALLRSEKVALCNALRWPVELFNALLAATGLGDIGAELDVDSASQLYRHVLLCRIFSVVPGDATRFFDLFYGRTVNAITENPLESPMATLAAFDKWTKLLDGGWAVKSLSSFVGRDDGEEDENREMVSGFELLSAISEGAQNIRKSIGFLSFNGGVPSSENIADCATRLFDSETAKVILDFIEGSQVTSEIVSLPRNADLPTLMKKLQSWPSRITVLVEHASDGTIRLDLELRGLLSVIEKHTLDQFPATLPVVEETLQTLVAQSIAPRQLLTSRFDCDSLKTSPQTRALFEDPELSEDGDSLEAERFVRERRQAFFALATPRVMQDLQDLQIIDVIKDSFPSLEVADIPVFLSRLVRIPLEGRKTESAMTALQRLGNDLAKNVEDHTKGDGNGNFDVYMMFTTAAGTDTVTFSDGMSTRRKKGTNEPPPPKLRVNQVDLMWEENKSAWKPLRLAPSRVHRLQGDFPLSQLRRSTTTGPTAPVLSPTSLVGESTKLFPTELVKQAARVSRAVSRVASICQSLRLRASELEVFDAAAARGAGAVDNRMQEPSSVALSINLNTPTTEDLVELQRYCELRDGLNAEVASQPSSPQGLGLVDLLRWLSENSDGTADVKAVATRVADCTGWDATRVREALAQKYRRHDSRDLVRSLSNLEALVQLRAIMTIDERLESTAGASARPSMSVLFSLAQPSPTLSDTGSSDAQHARDLQARLTPSQRARADEGLMENQRKALVAYLLHQKDVTEKMGIRDADGLFEHFLVDAQMGPQLRTSRIKLAISVVQLFVQRCLLGLEKDVAKGSVIREEWEWRQQYSLWEAHRKLFLYPENWAEPTLRDTKSELFERFEAGLMQKDLDTDAFLQAIRKYVYDLNDISRLDVVAYLHDDRGRGNGDDTVEDTFHLFARTRTAPYIFYHRSLIVTQPSSRETDSGGSGVFWRPWTRIGMDIPSSETDWQGKKLGQTGTHLVPILTGHRLYLFMPQVVHKTLASDKGMGVFSANEKFKTLADTPREVARPQYVWEVSMAWTELVDNRWSPKRVSPGCLNVSADTVAAPSQFHFDPMFESDRGSTKITIVVSYSAQIATGAFVFCEDQISTLEQKDIGYDPSPRPFTASYQAVSKTGHLTRQEIDQELKNMFGNDERGQRPLLWLPKGLGDSYYASAPVSISWTLSQGKEGAPLGLALSSQHSNGTRVGFFNVPRARLMPTNNWSSSRLDDKMELAVLDHGFAGSLVQATADQAYPLKRLYDYLGGSSPQLIKGSFGDLDGGLSSASPPMHHELAQPTSLYNWEIGLHAVLLVVDRFFATQQFEEALQAARLVFDPTVDTTVYRPSAAGSTALKQKGQSCWRFPPFQDIALRIAEDGKDKSATLLDLSKEMKMAILEGSSHGALVHATARGRPQAYMKWIIMKYAEILIASGDVYFRRGTMESLPLATQQYIEALHVLGPEPARVPPRLAEKKARVLTFEDLSREGIMVENELGLPFSAELITNTSGQKNNRWKKSSILSTYFCVPLNPKFKELRRLVDQRLFNARNSLNIDGKAVKYALIEPPIDPGALMLLSAQGASVVGAAAMISSSLQQGPLPRQRFTVLLQRALELCAELRTLGERLVAAMERKEGEAFAALRARHTTTISGMMLGLRKMHLDEAQQTVDSLLERRSLHASQLAFYLSLVGEPASRIPSPSDPWTDIRQDIDKPTGDDLRMSSYEKMEMSRANAASMINLVASSMDKLVIPLCLVPNIDTNIQPMGIGASIGIGGSNFASALQAGSAVVRNEAIALTDESNRAARKAALASQLQQRRLQANAHGREIKMLDLEIEIQKGRARAARREIEIQQAETENASQMEAWFRTKYTNRQLYGWLEKHLRILYAHAYTLTVAAARRAETALAFEQGRRVEMLPQGGSCYWDASAGGLLAGDYLYQDLKRLEASSLEVVAHDFEITKAVSLREINPVALLRLRLTGTATFSLGEILYDGDYPGHYMRRIKGIAISIPAVVGPYTGANATLTLLSHRYRVSATASTGAEYSSADRSDFRTDHVPMTAAAISSGSGSGDSGMFEFSFSGPQYMPFEGAGAASTWRLDLPTEIRRFDYETISDMVMHVRYTAFNGGARLQAAANEAVRRAARATEVEGKAEGFWAMWDLKYDFSQQWHSFSARLLSAVKSKTGGGETEQSQARLELGDLRDRLPYWSSRQERLKVCSLSLFSQSAKLVKGVEVVGVDGLSLGSTKDESVGNGTLTTWTDLNVKVLDGWIIKPKSRAKLLDEKDTTVKNMYMLIRYVLEGP